MARSVARRDPPASSAPSHVTVREPVRRRLDSAEPHEDGAPSLGNLTRVEAIERARAIEVLAYDIDLTFDRDGETFRTATRVRFRYRRAQEDTFIEHDVPRLRSVRLNGRDLDPVGVWAEGRIVLSGLAAENDLEIEADAAYSNASEGMHRFVDPEDGETYLHTQSFLDHAQRIFACFDQPDLKAPMTVRVTAPSEWTVIANAAGRQASPGRWTFAPTPPIATYLFAIAAGPLHSVQAEHDGIPLGIHCRRSLARYLDVDDLLADTRLSFDFCHRLFGTRYAFGKYDQIFVPEFLGAMENPGCVMYDDGLLFRSPVTDAARLERSTFLIHEMTHMWFGDLVTMRWWDDLWLNESFADFLSYVILTEGTRHTNAWTTFALQYKTFGYRADQLPSTHPVAGDAPDVEIGMMNFDAISYAKGAGVLKQMVAWIGRDAFEAGLRAYIAEYAYGNTTLADLMRAFEQAAGRDMAGWTAAWLQSAGVATLSLQIEYDDDGGYARVSVLQTAAAVTQTLRPHRIAIGLYDRAGDGSVRRERIEVDIDGARTDLPMLAGRAAADLVLLNDDDLTWAKVRLDERSLAAALGGFIASVPDSLSRAMLWMSLYDMVRDAELAVGDVVDATLDGLGPEADISILELLLRQVRDAIDILGHPVHRGSRLERLTDRAVEVMEDAEPGSDRQLAVAMAATRSATRNDQLDRIEGWLDGVGVPEGLVIASDLRWSVLARLATMGRIDATAIDAELARDPTLAGGKAAVRARASLPTVEGKVAAWAAAFDPQSSVVLRAATAAGFWLGEHVALTRSFRDRYLTEVERLWRDSAPESAAFLTRRLFPVSLIEPETVAMLDHALEQGGLNTGLRRVLDEARSDVQRAARTRELDRGGALWSHAGATRDTTGV